MKKIQFIVLNAIIFSMVTFSGVNGQSITNDKESARIFVQKFYDWFGTMGALSDELSNKDPMALCLSHKPPYFEDKLRMAIIEDEQAQEKSPGEIVGLDFDPIANAQDTRTGFQTGNVTQRGDKFFVDVHDIKKGQPHNAVLKAPLVLTVEVGQVEGHWEFFNFMYPKEDGGNNLLAILKSLKSDRVKWAAESHKKKSKTSTN
jgi:hypothetical protein